MGVNARRDGDTVRFEYPAVVLVAVKASSASPSRGEGQRHRRRRADWTVGACAEARRSRMAFGWGRPSEDCRHPHVDAPNALAPQGFARGLRWCK